MINEKNDYVDREILVYDLGIFELRGLARKLGVPSPTTKKRDELISLILEKIKSGDVIDQTGKKKGRPFKSLSAIDEIYSSITSICFMLVLHFIKSMIDESICSPGNKIGIPGG